MLNENHPDDERLSALATEEADATADAILTAHVTTCDRCTGLVDELGALRASLAGLPDLAPPRPLRLLPEVDAEPAARATGWVRRLFAPVLTAGAAIAMVGLVGTTAPALTGMNQGDAAPAFEEAAQDGAGAGAPEASALEVAPEAAEGVGDGGVLSATDDARAREGGENFTDQDEDVERSQTEDATGLPAERSPWPMVLFTGIAVMIGAALLRWILLPRAG